MGIFRSLKNLLTRPTASTTGGREPAPTGRDHAPDRPPVCPPRAPRPPAPPRAAVGARGGRKTALPAPTDPIGGHFRMVSAYTGREGIREMMLRLLGRLK